MKAQIGPRKVLAVIMIVTTFQFATSQNLDLSTVVEQGQNMLRSSSQTRVRTTVTKTQINIEQTAHLSVAAEAGKIQANVGLFGLANINLSLNLKGNYNSCGCGGDKCVKFGKCRISGFNPICCNDKCMCVQATVRQIADKLDATCGLCNVLSFTKLLCREATLTEFNCWTEYKNLDGPAEALYQFAYF